MKLRIPSIARLSFPLASALALMLSCAAQAAHYTFGTATSDPFTITATDQWRALGNNLGTFNDASGSIYWRGAASDATYMHFDLSFLTGAPITGDVSLNQRVDAQHGGQITTGQISTANATWTGGGGASTPLPFPGFTAIASSTAPTDGYYGTGSTATWTIPNATFVGFVTTPATFRGLVISAGNGSQAHFYGTPTLTGTATTGQIVVSSATDWSAASFNAGTTTLTVSGSNNVSGGNVAVKAGATLSILDDATLGSGAFAGSFSNNGTLSFGSSADQTLNGSVSGSGALVKDGIGALTLTAQNSFTGQIDIDGGILEFSADLWGSSPFQSTQININNGSTLKISGGSYQMPIYDGKHYTFDANGGGSILVGTGNYYANGAPFNVTTNGGARNTIGLISYSGDYGFNIGPAGVSFDVALGTDPTSDLTVAPIVVNSGSVVKNGAGRLTLDALNTYTGATTINEGTLEIGANGRLGGGNYGGAISIASGATLLHGSVVGQILSGNITGDGVFTKTGTGDLELQGTNTYSGVTRIDAGRLILNSTAAFSPNTSFEVNGAGQLYAGYLVTGNITNNMTLSGMGLVEAGVVVGVLRGSNGQTFSGDITLAGDSRIGMIDNGDSGFTISGKITGNHALDLQGALYGSNRTVTMTLGNTGAENDFTGKTSISTADFYGAQTGIKTALRLGSDNQIPNGTGKGNLVFNGADADHQTLFELNGFSETINGLSNVAAAGAVIRNTAAGASTLTIGDANTSSAFSGTITDGGAGSSLALTKSGTGALALNGTHSYSGDTTVTAGILALSTASNPANANPSNDASTVTIATTSATLDLTYTGTDIVDKLFIGATQKAPGVYGKSGSVLPIIGISQITGNGTLTVVGGFSAWIAGNGFVNGPVALDQRGPNDDPDNDGIPNLMEFAIAGQDPTVANAAIGSFTSNKLAFTKRAFIGGLSYAIVESTDLGITDDWTEVTGGSYVNTPTTISYTLTPGSPVRNFVRLKVVEMP